MNLCQHLVQLFRRRNGRARQRGPTPRNQAGQRESHPHVAKHGHELGTYRVLREVGQAVQPLGWRVFQCAGDRCGRHRRLLGGNHEAQHVDEHETEPVVQPVDDARRQGRQVQQRKLQLDQRHEGDDDAAAGRCPRHVQPLRTVLGDVVLTVAGRVVRHAARKQAHCLANVAAHLVTLLCTGDHLEQQRRSGVVRGMADEGRQHRAQSRHQLVHSRNEVGQPDRYADLPQPPAHPRQGRFALRQQHLGIAQLFVGQRSACGAGVFELRHQQCTQGEKRRLVLLQRGVCEQQFAVQCTACKAVRQHARRLGEAAARDSAAGIVSRRCNGLQQGRPRLRCHQGEPSVVVHPHHPLHHILVRPAMSRQRQ